MPQFPLSVGTSGPDSAEAAGSICQSPWKLKRRSPPGNGCHCCQDRGGRSFARSGFSLPGKGGDPEARAQSGNPQRGERVQVDAAAGACLLSSRPESALRRRDRDPAPLVQLGVTRVPWHLPGRPFVPQLGRTPARVRWLGWEGQHSRGRQSPCPPKPFFAHLVCCQDSEAHVVRQSDPQLPLISCHCVSFMQKFERDS